MSKKTVIVHSARRGQTASRRNGPRAVAGVREHTFGRGITRALL